MTDKISSEDFIKAFGGFIEKRDNIMSYPAAAGENKAHFWLCGGIMDKYITAWMPLPEPYKEGGAE